MDKDKQHIAIAEACYVQRTPDPLDRDSYCWADVLYPLDEWPDFTGDLNAMHKAEEIIKDIPEYCMNLCAVVYAPLTNAHIANRLFQGWWFTHATAAQRAEAFLKTIGKWID